MRTVRAARLIRNCVREEEGEVEGVEAKKEQEEEGRAESESQRRGVCLGGDLSLLVEAVGVGEGGRREQGRAEAE